jgi:hypothetical protein
LPTLRSRLFMVRPRSDLGQADSSKAIQQMIQQNHAWPNQQIRHGARAWPSPRTGSVKVDKNLANFLLSSKAERLVFVDKLAADIADDKKPKSAALDFCTDLSKHLHNGGVEKNVAALSAITKAESYLRDRAPSIKQLLEYVALNI